VGKIEQYLIDKINQDGAIHMSLLDPDKSLGCDCAAIAKKAAEGGTSAIMVGGSTVASNNDLDDVVQRIKTQVKIPVILFPNGPFGVSKYADAIWFMSLLNSANSYYLIDAQALSAPIVKRFGLEALPMGYIIAGEGCVAGFVGHARLINYRHPQLAVGYSMAAETLGMRFVYLEAGSGAVEPIPPKMIRAVRRHISIPLIVGGGIRNPDAAISAKEAGADIIVTGNLVEDPTMLRGRIHDIVSSIKN
jgi:phosphoglycerol geranylgeranyltransferase